MIVDSATAVAVKSGVGVFVGIGVSVGNGVLVGKGVMVGIGVAEGGGVIGATVGASSGSELPPQADKIIMSTTNKLKLSDRFIIV